MSTYSNPLDEEQRKITINNFLGIDKRGESKLSLMRETLPSRKNETVKNTPRKLIPITDRIDLTTVEGPVNENMVLNIDKAYN